MIVAEGVTMYLRQDIIKALLNALTDHFSNGQMAFDVHTLQLVWWLTKTGATVRGTGATFGWRIDHPQDIKQLEPRIEPVTELKSHDLAGYSKMSWNMRLLVREMDAIPALRVMPAVSARAQLSRGSRTP